MRSPGDVLEQKVSTDKDPPGSPSVDVIPKPVDDAKRPTPKAGKKDSEERKYSKWKPVPLSGEDARANKCDSNCAGLTFGKGCVYIDTTEMPKILGDNYAHDKNYKTNKLADQQKCVCCIVAWGSKDGYHHAALIVDVAADGVPIVYGKDGSDDVVSEYRADEYGPDWSVHCRTKKPESVELDVLTAEYEKAKAATPQDPAKTKLAAFRMCKLKNALKGI